MPNLRFASPVGHDDGDRSYVARTVSNGRPRRRRRDRDGVLRTVMITIAEQRMQARRANTQAGRTGRETTPQDEDAGTRKGNERSQV